MTQNLTKEAKKIYGEENVKVFFQKNDYCYIDIVNMTIKKIQGIDETIAEILQRIKRSFEKILKISKQQLQKYIEGLLEFTQMNNFDDYVIYIVKYGEKPTENIPII